MKFSFYVSNKATRLRKTIRYLSHQKEYVDLLKDIAFIYRDSEHNDDLGIVSHENHITFYQKEFGAIKKDERSKVVSDELLSLMLQHKVDYLLVFGSKLLKGGILNKYRNKIINFHPSLLPAFPGVKSIDQAFNYGSFVLGNTAHFIDEGIDTGPIIMQNICITNDVVGYDDILDNQILMLVQILLWLKQDRIKLRGRRVLVEDAEYRLGHFVPNIEEDTLLRFRPGGVVPGDE